MRCSLIRKTLLSLATLIGPALFSATAAAALTALPASDNPATKVVTIGVLVEGGGRGQPHGDVLFTESGSTLGQVSLDTYGSGNCPGGPTPMVCTLRLALPPGYPLGRHTITASYSGDLPHGPNPPESLTFTVYVSEFAWLPAVLDRLSD